MGVNQAKPEDASSTIANTVDADFRNPINICDWVQVAVVMGVVIAFSILACSVAAFLLLYPEYEFVQMGCNQTKPGDDCSTIMVRNTTEVKVAVIVGFVLAFSILACSLVGLARGYNKRNRRRDALAARGPLVNLGSFIA